MISSVLDMLSLRCLRARQVGTLWTAGYTGLKFWNKAKDRNTDSAKT